MAPSAPSMIISYFGSIYAMRYLRSVRTEYLWSKLEPDEMQKTFSIIDMKGLTFSMLVGETMKYVKKAIGTLGENYPERSYKTVILNASSAFSTAYRVVKLVIDPVTAAKIEVYSSPEKGKRALLRYISADVLPPSLGGSGPEFGQSPQEKEISAYVRELEREA